MVWMTPAPATAAAPYRTNRQIKKGSTPVRSVRSVNRKEKTHLWRSGQREQQVQRGLGEVEVLFGSQTELDGAEHRGQDRHPPHHRHPVLPVLVGAAQLLSQVECEHTHLQGGGGVRQVVHVSIKTHPVKVTKSRMGASC